MNPLGQIFGAPQTQPAAPIQTQPMQQQQPAPDMAQSAPMSPNLASGQPSGGIPQYIPADQARQFLQHLPPQITPEAALETLVKQGHIIQGVNDQNMQQSQDPNSAGTGTVEPQEGLFGNLGSALGNFGKGIIKGIGSVGEAGRQVLQTITGVNSTPTKQQADLLNAHGAAQSVGKFTGQALPYVAAGMATGGGAPLALDMATQGTAGFMTTQGGLGDRAGAGTTAAILGPVANKYVFSPLISKVAPLLTRTAEGGVGDVALNAYKGAFKDVEGAGTAMRNEFGAGAKAITEANPGKTISLDFPELNDLQTAAKQSGVKLPKSVQIDLGASEGSAASGIDPAKLKGVPIANLNPSETTDLLTALGKKRYLNGTTNTPVEMLIDSLHEKASTAFGEEFDNLYKNYAIKSDAIKSLADVFDVSGKTAQTTTQEKVNSIKRITEYLNDKQKAPIFQDALSNFKEITGVDLNNPTKAIAAANKIKNPLIKKSAIALLKYVGLPAIGVEAAAHFSGGQ